MRAWDLGEFISQLMVVGVTEEILYLVSTPRCHKDAQNVSIIFKNQIVDVAFNEQFYEILTVAM